MGLPTLQTAYPTSTADLAGRYHTTSRSQAAKDQALQDFCTTYGVPADSLRESIDRLRNGNQWPPRVDEIDGGISGIVAVLGNSLNPALLAQLVQPTSDAQNSAAVASNASGRSQKVGQQKATASPVEDRSTASTVAGASPPATSAPDATANANAAASGADPGSKIMDDLRHLLHVLGIPPEQIDRVLSLLLTPTATPAGTDEEASNDFYNHLALEALAAYNAQMAAGGVTSGPPAPDRSGGNGASPAAQQPQQGPSYRPQSMANTTNLSRVGADSEPAVAPATQTTPAGAPGPQGSADTYVAKHPALEAEIARREQSDPAGAKALRELSQQPVAMWHNGNPDDGRHVKEYMDGAEAAGKKGLIAIYDIPGRDLGNFSKGGAGSGDAYLAHINEVAQAIGTRKADVILEPDALMDSSRMDPAAGSARRHLMHQAVDILAAQPNTTVSIAAGGPGWGSPAQVADALIESGVGKARNFSVGESSFTPTNQLMAYGDAVVAELAKRGVTGVHYSVETGRNGVEGHASGVASWAEMDGAASGTRPTSDQAIINNPNVSQFNWVKTPWQADGRIAAAGSFIPDYAISMVKNAHANGIW